MNGLTNQNEYGFNFIFVKNGLVDELIPEVSVESVLTHPSVKEGYKKFEEIKAYAKSIGGPEELQRWDLAFYSEKLKKEKITAKDKTLLKKLNQEIEKSTTTAARHFSRC